eukprot:6202679-Pleurochrysis_carterae.AAC.1
MLAAARARGSMVTRLCVAKRISLKLGTARSLHSVATKFVPTDRRKLLAGAAAAATVAAALYVEHHRRAESSGWFAQKARLLHFADGTTLIMSGDCGGTNTRLRVFHVPPDAHTKLAHGQKPPGVVVFDKTYVNEEHKSIEDICKLFLKEAAPFSGSMVPTSCCLACAGAITDNSVVFTNVADGWTIRGESLSKSLGIPKVVLVNDFVAQGYGLLTLEDSEKMLLNDAKPVPGAPIACVGAGTVNAPALFRAVCARSHA